jgi:hypothetical protein
MYCDGIAGSVEGVEECRKLVEGITNVGASRGEELQFTVEHELPEIVEKFDEYGKSYLAPEIEGRRLTVRFLGSGLGTLIYWRNQDGWEQFAAGPYPHGDLVRVIREFLDNDGERPDAGWRPDPDGVLLDAEQRMGFRNPWADRMTEE